MILTQFKLDDQVAVVTGANRGLGLEMAAALAEAGAHIVSVQRSNNIQYITKQAHSTGFGRCFARTTEVVTTIS